MDPELDYTREASSRYQQVYHQLILLPCFNFKILLQVLVQDPYRKWNAARAVTSAKHWKKIQTELKHSVQTISSQPDVGFAQLCKQGADQDEDEFNLDGLTMDQLIARLRM